jgi:hypothetical protein
LKAGLAATALAAVLLVVGCTQLMSDTLGIGAAQAEPMNGGGPYTVTILVTNIDGTTPVQGVKVRYGSGHAATTSFFAGGALTGPDGKVSQQLAGGTYSFQASVNNGSQVVYDVVVDGDKTVRFETVTVTLRLEACDTGAPIDGGQIRYGAGGYFGTSYWPGGLTGSSDPGETEAELFPGTYSFQMNLNSTSEAKTSVAIPTSDTTLTWKATKLTLDYDGSISYGGPSGDARWFNKPSMYLMPGGTYTFHFRGASRTDIKISGCVMDLTGVKITLHNDGVELNDPKYYLEVQRVGKLYNGDVVVTEDTTWKLRARTGSVAGPWFTFNTARGELVYEYATINVLLRNEDEVLDEVQYYLEIQHIGKVRDGETFHVPLQATIKYRARTGSIAGPWLTRKWGVPGPHDWRIDYATINVLLRNEDEVLDEEQYYLEIQHIGKVRDGETFHVPLQATIKYRARTGSIAGPWMTRKWGVPGPHNWVIEYVTVHITLVNAAGEELPNPPYSLEIQHIGKLGTCDTFHIPVNSTIKWRPRNGSTAGPWKTQSWSSGGLKEWQVIVTL